MLKRMFLLLLLGICVFTGVAGVEIQTFKEKSPIERIICNDVFPSIKLIAGNIATAEAAQNLIYLHEGSPSGSIAYVIDGNRILKGNRSGPIAYIIDGDRILKGNPSGPIAYIIDGDRILKGNRSGPIAYIMKKS